MAKRSFRIAEEVLPAAACKRAPGGGVLTDVNIVWKSGCGGKCLIDRWLWCVLVVWKAGPSSRVNVLNRVIR